MEQLITSLPSWSIPFLPNRDKEPFHNLPGGTKHSWRTASGCFHFPSSSDISFRWSDKRERKQPLEKNVRLCLSTHVQWKSKFHKATPCALAGLNIGFYKVWSRFISKEVNNHPQRRRGDGDMEVQYSGKVGGGPIRIRASHVYVHRYHFGSGSEQVVTRGPFYQHLGSILSQ